MFHCPDARAYQGPDLWLKVTVPKGVHRVSLYFFNKDGHGNKNRFRDFPIEVTPYTPSLEHAERLAVLARARVHDFWGGVYKSFAVHGPNRYWFHIKKNYSYDTILSAVMIQRLQGPPLWIDSIPMGISWTGGEGYDPPDITGIVKSADTLEPASVAAGEEKVPRVVFPALRPAAREQYGAAPPRKQELV